MVDTDPEAVWMAASKADGLDARSREILMTLAGLADSHGVAVSSERDLASGLGLSRSLVWHRLHKLEDLGWLVAKRNHGSKTEFILLIPGGA